MNEIEIGPSKRAGSGFSFDDVAIVPSRRTRVPEEVSTNWQIDAYKFSMPIMAAPMDSVVSPETAIAIGKLDRKSTRLNSSHSQQSRMPSSA